MHVDLSDVPVYLVDGAELKLKLSADATVAAACAAIAEDLALAPAAAAFYSLCVVTGTEPGYAVLPEDSVLCTLLSAWSQASLRGGLKRLVFRRTLAMRFAASGSCVVADAGPLAAAEAAATPPRAPAPGAGRGPSGAAALLFAEAVYAFLHGLVRLRVDAVVPAAAALLAAGRGLPSVRALDASVDTLASVRAVITEAVPVYALKKPWPRDAPAFITRAHGLRDPASDAMLADELAAAVHAAMPAAVKAASSGGGGAQAAQRAFINLIAASPIFGANVFAGRRCVSKTATGTFVDELMALGPSAVTFLGNSGARAYVNEEFLLLPEPGREADTVEICMPQALPDGSSAFAFTTASNPPRAIVFACTAADAAFACWKRRIDCMAAVVKSKRWPPPRRRGVAPAVGAATVVDSTPAPAPAYAAMPRLFKPPTSATAGADGSSGGGAAAAGTAAHPPTREGMPPHWWQVFGADGAVSYYNELTHLSQTERPRPLALPPPWERVPDGNIFFYVNERTGATSWFPPDPTAWLRALRDALPPGWAMALTSDDATPYYVHTATAKSTWAHPAEQRVRYAT